ncbi:MAG: hypothetical protein JSU82_07315 [Rhodospirillales bacterium]|nr:MAG: hypothetical protein JSU82_07315 [Rhodospirillales bacterium]
MAATEATPRARLKTSSRPTIAQPAAAPRSPAAATAAMSMTQIPSTRLLATQKPLRTGMRRITPPIRICGISASDSRIGTSRPTR